MRAAAITTTTAAAVRLGLTRETSRAPMMLDSRSPRLASPRLAPPKPQPNQLVGTFYVWVDWLHHEPFPIRHRQPTSCSYGYSLEAHRCPVSIQRASLPSTRDERQRQSTDCRCAAKTIRAESRLPSPCLDALHRSHLTVPKSPCNACVARRAKPGSGMARRARATMGRLDDGGCNASKTGRQAP
ncbi:hypothetical protein B0T19DRAFT_216969 [Cercophora scortea]|uniref:Uncharacterized protein n=1 Tax=Cercophora scortea TaxID=314031 RepID=A0AAE0IFD4_9PEZI|nr:hypothetical protein B0T19DRAFT_216969 [Cercophora scortea]